MADEPRYTTVLGFNKSLEMDSAIPNRVETGDPVKETIGTGDGSTKKFYFDNGFLIRNSETLYYGSTEAAATDVLVRDTDYTIDYDLGEITLSDAILATVGVQSIYGVYSYNKYSKKDSELYLKLTRAETEIDEMIDTVFVDGTTATPDWGVAQNEDHMGQGSFNRVYQTDKYPLNSTTTTATDAVSAADTTVTVGSTNGFPASGYFGIGNDKVQYSEKTDTEFTVVTGLTTAHAAGVDVTPFIVEIATDDEGNTPTWQPQSWKSEFDVDFKAGEVKINNDAVEGTILLDNFHPPNAVFNRLRLTYQYGYDTIPADIKRAVYMIAGKEMYTTNVLNALARSSDGFSSEAISDIDSWLKKIIQKYHTILIKDL